MQTLFLFFFVQLGRLSDRHRVSGRHEVVTRRAAAASRPTETRAVASDEHRPPALPAPWT